VATWAEFEAAAPELAAFGRKLMPGIPLAYLATIRPDGGPRLHPFCPIFTEGRLYGAIGGHTPKARDLRRDGRYVIHALPGLPSDDEFSLRGDAREADDPSVRAALEREVVAAGAGGMIDSVRHDPIFEFDIERVDSATWELPGQEGTYAVRQRWLAPDRGEA
jgi:hypothetical protein